MIFVTNTDNFSILLCLVSAKNIQTTNGFISNLTNLFNSNFVHQRHLSVRDLKVNLSLEKASSNNLWQTQLQDGSPDLPWTFIVFHCFSHHNKSNRFRYALLNTKDSLAGLVKIQPPLFSDQVDFCIVQSKRKFAAPLTSMCIDMRNRRWLRIHRAFEVAINNMEKSKTDKQTKVCRTDWMAYTCCLCSSYGVSQILFHGLKLDGHRISWYTDVTLIQTFGLS